MCVWGGALVRVREGRRRGRLGGAGCRTHYHSQPLMLISTKGYMYAPYNWPFHLGGVSGIKVLKLASVVAWEGSAG